MQDAHHGRDGEGGAVRESSPEAGNKPLSGEATPMGGEAAVQAETVFRVTGVSLAYRYLFIGLLSLVGAVVFYAMVPTYLSSRDWVVMIILGFWALALVRYWVYLFDMPHKVTLRDDGHLEFLSVFRRRGVPAASILSVKVSPLYPTYLKFRTAQKKSLVMINHVDGLHELVGRIRKASPGLKTKGC